MAIHRWDYVIRLNFYRFLGPPREETTIWLVQTHASSRLFGGWARAHFPNSASSLLRWIHSLLLDLKGTLTGESVSD